jgi:Type IV secretion system pilin
MKPLLTTLILSFLILPLFTFAQYKPAVGADGTISEGLVPCEGAFCSTCDVVVLANTGIKWLLTLSFLFFAVLAVYAGSKLIMAQGRAGALQDAKQSFTNAFIGLIIILVAWILVDTLLRNVLGKNGELSGGVIEGYGPWSKIECVEQVVPGEAVAGYFEGDAAFVQTLQNATPAGTSIQASTGCSGSACVQITIPCVAKGCTISADMVDKLSRMHQQAAVAGARVTEAMPPSRSHKSPCHTQGWCVDYSKAGGMNAAEVKRVIDAAYAAGLRPVYEVSTPAEANSLVSGGVPRANILVLGSHISAPHFSIYGR